MDKDQPVSKQVFEAGLAAAKSELEAKIDTKIDGLRTEILDRMERMETSLLTAFHSYAHGVSAHFKVLDVQGASLMERMAALEDRMINLETRGRRQ